ncbi:hypothetical protein FH972_000435 [Carpinus fangiana]|uniref:Uncharacterized protein n=1 Tax=Carpinus fangiana TaxID=176857 RepID=A0A5N6QB67_9ROSI|nr:hypothetical protein FH972_000435 [Carpinus fangiana]
MAAKNVFISLVLISCLLANATATRDLAFKSESNAPATAQTNSEEATQISAPSAVMPSPPSQISAGLPCSLPLVSKLSRGTTCEAESRASVADSLPKHMPPTI